jgi:protein TilB
MKQRNEGGWDFFWDEESRPGFVVLDVHVAKHLDSSLIDVDVHPMFVSIIIKSKVRLLECQLCSSLICGCQVLRLRLPAEVRVSDSKCQRSKISGSLMVIMPKVCRSLIVLSTVA